MRAPTSRQWTRDPMDELHVAAHDGSVERTLAVLSRGEIDIDEGRRDGSTPLMYAAVCGNSRVAKALLNKGANIYLANNRGMTALHVTAQRGHLAVTKLLTKAGADLEAKIPDTGSTPLHLAAERGHSEAMKVLIEAGVNPNSRALGGSTPLYMAASDGHVDAVKVLLRAKANPRLTFWSSSPRETFVPLDAAAGKGHVEVARELIRQHGIKGCGGATGGVKALQAAAESQLTEIMELLTSAGVVDTGIALRAAAHWGCESSVNFLLQQQQQRWKSIGQGAGYLGTRDQFGRTPLVCSVNASSSCSPRISRLLVDAGADTTATVRLKTAEGRVIFNDNPLALVDSYLRGKMIGTKKATESQLHSLEATRRLLMRVEAVHAVSWLWASDAQCNTHAATERTGKATKATPTPLILMLPVLKGRAGRPRVLLAALFRLSNKPRPALSDVVCGGMVLGGLLIRSGTGRRAGHYRSSSN